MDRGPLITVKALFQTYIGRVRMEVKNKTNIQHSHQIDHVNILSFQSEVLLSCVHSLNIDYRIVIIRGECFNQLHMRTVHRNAAPIVEKAIDSNARNHEEGGDSDRNQHNILRLPRESSRIIIITVGKRRIHRALGGTSSRNSTNA